MSTLPLLMVYKCQPKNSDKLWSLEQDQHLEANSHQLFNPYGLICFLDTPALSQFPFPLLPQLHLTLSLYTPPPYLGLLPPITSLRVLAPVPSTLQPPPHHCPYWLTHLSGGCCTDRDIWDTTRNPFKGHLIQSGLLTVWNQRYRDVSGFL